MDRFNDKVFVKQGIVHDFPASVENVKKLYHASLLTHDLFTWLMIYNNASINSHSQLSAYSKETHTMSRCKHVPEQCHVWGDKTGAVYMLFGYV